MTLDEFRIKFSWPFPGAATIPTTPFGLDARTFKNKDGSPDARYHPAADLALLGSKAERYGEFPLVVPGDTVRTKWYGPDDSGTTWLDLVGDGWAWRYAHIFREEIKEDVRALILQGLPLKRGDMIGPAGNAGKSLGRHLHAMLILEAGLFDDVLTERWGKSWTADDLPAWGEKYPSIKQKIAEQGWRWANENAGYRKDPRLRWNCYTVDWINLLFK